MSKPRRSAKQTGLMWYYVDNGQQQGPFDETQFDGLVAAGTIAPATLVWKEGQPNWLPLNQIRPGPTAVETCQVCNKPVGADNLIELSGVRVCAACKPVALQKMREGVGLAGDGVFVEGKKLVTRDGAVFPARCVKCNTPTGGEPLKRKLYWQHPLLILLIFTPYLGLIAYVIVSIIVRKKATIYMHVCPEHRRRRIYFVIGTWVGLVFGITLILASAVFSHGWMAIAGSIMFIAGAVLGVFGARIVRTTRINDAKIVWLKGAGKEFMASLPPWNGA